MPSLRRRVPLLALLLIAAVSLVLILRHRQTTPPAETHAAAPPTAAPSYQDRPAAPPPTVAASRINSVEAIRGAMEEYKQAAAYPHWSRPHDAGSKYLLEWNKALTEELPLSDDPSRGLSYVFDADKHHVLYGDAYTSWIEVLKKEPGGTAHRVPATISAAWVFINSGPQQGRVLQLSYHDDGQDGDQVADDHRYTNRFIPAEVEKLKKAQQVRIQAIIEVEGERRMAIRDFTYAPRASLQISSVTDSVKNGSLVITLSVEAFEKGLYTFQGNLMSADGSTAIAWSDQSWPLDAGKTTVDLTFFGKAIKDRGIAGPYMVRDLRGFERFLDNSEANLWFSYPSPYMTRAYALADLSDADWNSPEKQEKLARFQQLIDDTASGRAGQPTNQPSHIHVGADGKETVIPPGAQWPPPPEK